MLKRMHHNLIICFAIMLCLFMVNIILAINLCHVLYKCRYLKIKNCERN